MARVHVFADESGNLDFSGRRDASRYFILTTVTAPDCRIGDELQSLRRQLAWEGEKLTPDFHCTEERQAVRDRVFEVIGGQRFRIDVTVLEKAKAYEHVKADEVRFYKTAWYLHFKFIARRIVAAGDQLLVLAASIGTKTKQGQFHTAIKEVMEQTVPNSSFQTAFWMARTDPCLQIVDYCSWAVQRKWERSDERSYVLIKDKIRSEFDAWRIRKTG